MRWLSPQRQVRPLRLSPRRLIVQGLAACNIGGVTIHSFAGISLGEGTVDDLVELVRKNPKAKDRWLAAQSLIVDEGMRPARVIPKLSDEATVSMLDGGLFDKLSQIGSRLRNNPKPFGGIQVRPTPLTPSTR